MSRLSETIALLRRVEAHEGPYRDATFDYGSWVLSDHPCETVACAGGYMALHPPFIDQGLYADACGTPIFGDLNSHDALAAFLGITEAQARTAFIDLNKHLSALHGYEVPNYAVTAGEVAEYLETLLPGTEGVQA